MAPSHGSGTDTEALTDSINRYYPGPQLDAKGKPRARLVIEGHPIEDDTYIAVAPSANLHDADLFADPLNFDITRYERGEGPNEYTYVAWGYGRHSEWRRGLASVDTADLAGLSVQSARACASRSSRRRCPWLPYCSRTTSSRRTTPASPTRAIRCRSRTSRRTIGARRHGLSASEPSAGPLSSSTSNGDELQLTRCV